MKRSVKLIKRHERKPRRAAIVESAVGPNRCSKAVRSWVVDFRGRDRSSDAPGLPAFDSLFKDVLLQSEPAE